MAKIDDGILGGFRGKVGPVIGYRWKDKWCMRARPVHVHNPRTAAQTAHRTLFREMVQLAAALKEGLRLGLRERARRDGMTEMNAFCRLNWREDGRPPYQALRVSEGPVAPVAFGAARLEGDVVRVEFGGGAARGGDGVRLLVLNATRRQALLSAPAARRRGSLALVLPTGWAADELHLYGFAADSAGRCSPSAYVGWDDGEDGSAILSVDAPLARLLPTPDCKRIANNKKNYSYDIRQVHNQGAGGCAEGAGDCPRRAASSHRAGPPAQGAPL